jgi:hypothetical protein
MGPSQNGVNTEESQWHGMAMLRTTSLGTTGTTQKTADGFGSQYYVAGSNSISIFLVKR